MFGGRAAKHAPPRAKFLPWAVAQTAGVGGLGALRNAKDPATWCPRHPHVAGPGTGELAASGGGDERWAARAQCGNTPGCGSAGTPQGGRNARKLGAQRGVPPPWGGARKTSVAPDIQNTTRTRRTGPGRQAVSLSENDAAVLGHQ